MAVRRMSRRLPACPSLDGTTSLDLGSAEYCSSRCTFSAELICMATKMGSLLPSSRLDGLALCCSNSNTMMSSPDRRASQSVTPQASRSHAASSNFFLLQALHGIKPSRVTSKIADSKLLETENQQQKPPQPPRERRQSPQPGLESLGKTSHKTEQ